MYIVRQKGSTLFSFNSFETRKWVSPAPVFSTRGTPRKACVSVDVPQAPSSSHACPPPLTSERKPSKHNYSKHNNSPPTGTDSAKERARHAMEAHKERREQLRKDEEETSESGEDGHRGREIKGTDGSVA